MGPNPTGWTFGLTHATVTNPAPWMDGLPETLKQYGAHIEQVTALPKGADILTTAPACPVAGFCMGASVYTTQNHPEMTPRFIEALVAEYHDKLPEGVGERAKASLCEHADTTAYAESIACFFEQSAD